jgi:hypothetical protein
MPGLVPGIHVFLVAKSGLGVDGRDIGVLYVVLRTAMPGHDNF